MNIIKPATYILFIIAGSWAFFGGKGEWQAPVGVGYMIIFLYFYHLNKTNRSYFGIKMEPTLFIPPLIFALIFFIRGLFLEYDIKQCEEGCVKGTDDICIKDSGGDEEPCQTDNMNQSGFWTSPKLIVISSMISGLLALSYQSYSSKGKKDATVQGVFILISLFLLLVIIYLLFDIGNPYYVFTKGEDKNDQNIEEK